MEEVPESVDSAQQAEQEEEQPQQEQQQQQPQQLPASGASAPDGEVAEAATVAAEAEGGGQPAVHPADVEAECARLGQLGRELAGVQRLLQVAEGRSPTGEGLQPYHDR